MKAFKFLSLVMLAATLFFAACKEKDVPTPGPGKDDGTTTPAATDTGRVVTIAEAIKIIDALEDGGSTDSLYIISGEVIQNNTDPATVPGEHTDINITIKDSTGTLGCYYMKNLGNQAFTSQDQVPLVGSKITLIGKLKKYLNKKTSATTPEMANGYIYSIEKMAEAGNPSEAKEATISEILAIGEKLSVGETTPEYYKVTGTITQVKTAAANVPDQYKDINLTIKDATGSIDSYYTKYLENKAFTSAEQIPAVGSKVVIIAPVCRYNESTTELKGGYISEILEEGDGSRPVISDATAATVSEVLKVGEALNTNQYSEKYYKVTGIITTIKTDAAKVPNQFNNINLTIKDETGTIDSYLTNYLENKPFTSAEQIPLVNSKVVIIAQVFKYNETTVELKDGYISEILEEGDGIQTGDIEGDLNCLFTAKAMPEGWTLIVADKAKEPNEKDDFYADFAIKIKDLKKGIESPEFEAQKTVTVKFNINKLYKKGDATATSGTFRAIGYNAKGEEVANGEVTVNDTGIYSITLTGNGIVKVRLIMTQFPYKDGFQQNAALKEVSITFDEAYVDEGGNDEGGNGEGGNDEGGNGEGGNGEGGNGEGGNENK